MQKALVIGIDHYRHMGRLYGCVKDARSVQAVLEWHGDGTRNFDVMPLFGTGPKESVPREAMREAIRELFTGTNETAVLYFAGHGYMEQTGGYLLASDSRTGDDGIALGEVMTWANASKTRNRVIVLDSCHSGIAGAQPLPPHQSELSEGLTILTASTADQYTVEDNGAGVFTTLFVNALNGAAANLVGEISPGSVYAHIDQSLGSWAQRPVFKTNVTEFVKLRRVRPAIPLEDLQRITEFFPDRGHEFPLDPSYEPTSPSPVAENTAKFAILQKMNRVNLVVPVGAEHMYFAAMENRSCRLTVLGEHYRRLRADRRI
jgi:hypothetical protein